MRQSSCGLKYWFDFFISFPEKLLQMHSLISFQRVLREKLRTSWKNENAVVPLHTTSLVWCCCIENLCLLSREFTLENFPKYRIIIKTKIKSIIS